MGGGASHCSLAGAETLNLNALGNSTVLVGQDAGQSFRVCASVVVGTLRAGVKI